MGMFGSLLGVFAMLAFLFLACQLLIGLYAASVVQATAYNAAYDAARIDPESASDFSPAAIEEQARTALGPMGNNAVFVWSVDPDRITVQIAVDPPGFVPSALSSNEWKAITRRAVVRRERLIDLVTPDPAPRLGVGP